AIDHPNAKNLIGAFHQPRLVLVDPAVVRSLPEVEFRAGLAEIVKHGIVLDADYFAEVERDAAPLCARDLPVVERIIGGSCRLKASVVERDERESELRHVLNYGHTIGHALEAATGYARFAPGEAVALGIVAEARLAPRLGLAAAGTVARHPPAGGAAPAGSRIAGVRAAGRPLPQGRADARGGDALPGGARPLPALHHRAAHPRQGARGRGDARGGARGDERNSRIGAEGRPGPSPGRGAPAAPRTRGPGPRPPRERAAARPG